MLLKIALGNVRRSLRDFSVFFVTLAFGVCVFYAFGSVTDQSAAIDLTRDERETVQALAGILSGVSVFVVVVLGFLVVYANRFLIRRRKREFGLYLTLGMDLAHVSAIVVLEALVVGLGALAVGLVLGLALSQLMMFVTARLFETTVTGFTLAFSPRACVQTVTCFAGIFAVSLLLSVSSVARYRLIDLINADRVPERVRLRSLPLSVALFVVSLALVGVAYWVLLRWGMLSDGPQFAIATGLVSVGTVLLFFSVSGFLLRLVQSSERLYLRGLNMFVLRQLNSRVNTAWLSITMVCAMLFLAVCGVCTGFSVANGYNASVDRATAYDASLIGYPVGSGAPAEDLPAAAWGYDAVASLSEGVPGWSSLVADAVQVDTFRLDEAQGPTLGWLRERTDYAGTTLTDQLLDEMAEVTPQVVRVSQLNALRAFQGKAPIVLGEGQCVFWNDLGLLDGFFQAVARQVPTVEVYGHALSFASDDVADDPLADYPSSTMTGALVVPDDVVPSDAVPDTTVVNVSYAGERAQVEPRFTEAVRDMQGASAAAGGEEVSLAAAWPASVVQTAEGLLSEMRGTKVSVTYLAVYVGVILLVSCSSVLALQQLSESADNVGRYRVLLELGAERSMVRRALASQIGIYFLFPLVVAVCHAAVALYVINDVVFVLTGYQIGGALLATMGLVVALYGGYYLVTYLTSRGMVLRGAGE